MKEMIVKELIFLGKEFDILRSHGLLTDIAEMQITGRGGYTNDGEDLFYNCLFSMYQRFCQLRSELNTMKSDLSPEAYTARTASVDKSIRDMSETLNKLLEAEIEGDK